MGNCMVSNQLREEIKQDKEISKFLKEEGKKVDDEIKLLLLGAGESGKSTIAKQMKILHLDGFSTEEKLKYKTIIYTNIIASIKTLIQACKDLNIPIEDEKNAEVVAEYDFGNPLTRELATKIKDLWTKDSGIKQAYERQSEFQLIDSAGYYFDNIDRISNPDYVPDQQDLLRSRVRTTGILETEFRIENAKFRMVDVGGQRSERKKWMHCFQDVTAVVYVTALSEYDLKLFEDESMNRMHESLKLFKEICNSKWFVETAIILFLNKTDIFKEKIKKTDLTVCFPAYHGGKDWEKASAYIREKFVTSNENPKKQIYTHFTCATDTQNVQVVFNAVKDIVLHKILDDSGLGF